MKGIKARTKRKESPRLGSFGQTADECCFAVALSFGVDNGVGLALTPALSPRGEGDDMFSSGNSGEPVAMVSSRVYRQGAETFTLSGGRGLG
jgi:hypothetical protein